MPAVLQVRGLFIHHIRAFPTFDYSKATTPALGVAFSSILFTNKSNSETIMILPIFGESGEFCLGLPRGWLGPPWSWLGPLMRLTGTFPGLAWASQRLVGTFCRLAGASQRLVGAFERLAWASLSQLLRGLSRWNKAGYTAADASGSAFSLIPVARYCACAYLCVSVCVRVCACVCACVLLSVVIAAPLTRFGHP